MTRREPRRGPRAVLFDWDGTLLDSAETTYRCYVRLFASFGIHYDRPLFERTYAPNWYETYAAVGLPVERRAEADARWLALYAEEGSALVPGARETLLRLDGAGLPQGLVTSGSRERVARELATLELRAFFRVLICGDDAAEKKPRPGPLLAALDRLGVSRGEAAYVGDSPEDIEMARAAGVFSIGVPGGFPNREALRASSPDALAATLSAAVDLLLAR